MKNELINLLGGFTEDELNEFAFLISPHSAFVTGCYREPNPRLLKIFNHLIKSNPKKKY